MVAIPLLNLLAIPLCVTAGTLFMIERGALDAIDGARTTTAPTRAAPPSASAKPD
jgi:citrate lyase gamma subunit